MGFITVGGGPQFFCFWMPLIGWRLGQKSYYQAKVYFHAKVRGFRDSIGGKVKRGRILVVLAERRISLTENAVGIWGI